MTTSDPSLLRLLVFATLFALFAILESLWPRRERTLQRSDRWLGNLGILAAGSMLARVILPVAPIGAAMWAQQQGFGIFNAIDMPILVAGLLAFLLLDLLIYGQHRLFHAVPILWRLHRMHHTDMDLDVTSGLRFHPIEIILSLIIKITAVCILGAPLVAVLFFEVILNATSMFNHSNFALPHKLESVLRLFLVTPDMHRVHHSIRPIETDRNFGFNIPWWDRLFGTYLAEPHDGHRSMTIGLPIFRDKRATNVVHLLIQPFAKDRNTNDKKGSEENPPP